MNKCSRSLHFWILVGMSAADAWFVYAPRVCPSTVDGLVSGVVSVCLGRFSRARRRESDSLSMQSPTFLLTAVLTWPTRIYSVCRTKRREAMGEECCVLFQFGLTPPTTTTGVF